MYMALSLYLIGVMFVLTFLEPEEGHERDIRLLAAFWPLFTLYVVFCDMFLAKPEEDEE